MHYDVGKQLLVRTDSNVSEGNVYLAEWTSSVITVPSDTSYGLSKACFSYDIWTHAIDRISAKLFYLRDDDSTIKSKDLIGRSIRWRTRDAIDLDLNDVKMYQVRTNRTRWKQFWSTFRNPDFGSISQILNERCIVENLDIR